jgi:glucosamine-6-phosphate deaminase
MTKPVKTFQRDKLRIEVYNKETEMGMAAADFTASRLQSALGEKGSANLILATGTSQFAFLEALRQKDIQWEKVTVFHLDEYIGIAESHPASFRNYLKTRILNYIKPGKVYLINGDARNLQKEMDSYEKLLKRYPVDIACIGIGENGHIAFNDPPVADFNDPLWVKEVELDHDCRVQQLGEGWFASLDEVPRKAVTLTVTAIMNCRALSCVVPGSRKATAVDNTLNAQINERCPATILRHHPDATLFLDKESASGN